MEEVVAVVRKAVAKHGDDVQVAVGEAIKLVRKLPSFETFVSELVDQQVRRMVYDERHSQNIRLRAAVRSGGNVESQQKVNIAKSKTVLAESRWFGLFIGGMTLGNIAGADLVPLAEKEESLASGHQFNALLLRKLSSKVPEGKTVREAIKASELDKLADNIQKALVAA